MSFLIITAYFFLLLFVLLFSVTQLLLALKYRRNRPTQFREELNKMPQVTIQLPIYNEMYVVERLIDKIVEIEYPKELLEIQILDDSTDKTSEIISEKVSDYKNIGFDISHVRREDNIDFKAGALKFGMAKSKGEFIAIFDADFLPDKTFLKETIPHFNNEKVGVVQTRWGHLNENYSVLTKLQSFALNAHFSVEQVGRSASNCFLNFNGTAGVWRKNTIEDAGGWEGDTITEDLDLSYRAQLKGWQIKYLEEVVSPAELPPEINSLKSQQYRWAKGAAECARKNLTKVLKSDLPFQTKWHAFFHLTNSFNWFALLGGGVLLVPFLKVTQSYFPSSPLWLIFYIFHISFLCLFVFYWIGNSSISLNSRKDKLKFLFYYPAFLTLSMGISLNTSLGVMRGYLKRKSAFIRTPKFNLMNKQNSVKNGYVRVKLTWVSLLEVLCFFYALYGVMVAWELKSYIALPFIVMQSIGFLIVSYSTIKWQFKS